VPPALVRPAAPADGPAFLALVEELARYEKLDPPDAAARARLLEDAFGARPRFALHVAELDGTIVAYAILLETYSSFLARPTLWIEDVYVTPTARRAGVGRALMRAIAREALARGCHRVEGVVLSWNALAQEFYKRTGGAVRDDWWLLRYDREAIEALGR
jgi:GNAT superfamily N-acetyltransferase